MKLELGVCAWDSRPHPKGIHNPGARSERDFDCKDWVSGFVAEKLTDLELNPCPFCGSTDLELDNIRQEDDFFVSCNNCEVQQIANYTRLEAVRRWNIRPVSPKAAEATPNCICATNCHFDCEDKLCKCPHHLTAAEAPGGQDAAPVMRCSKCKGTLIYKRTDEGFVIFEDSCGRKAIAPAAPSERADELVFTPEQVECLNIYQSAGVMHPFTCVCGKANLFATVRGWICPLCDYTQNWAHDFMKTFKSRVGLSSQEGK